MSVIRIERLARWYSGDDARAKLGPLSRAINEQGETVGVLGTREEPLILIEDYDMAGARSRDVVLSIEAARSAWTEITLAAIFYNTRFRILVRTTPRAVLSRHPKNRHPASKYRGSSSISVRKKLDSRLEQMMEVMDRFDEKLERFEEKLGVIDRHFREVWRHSNGLPASNTVVR